MGGRVWGSVSQMAEKMVLVVSTETARHRHAVESCCSSGIALLV